MLIREIDLKDNRGYRGMGSPENAMENGESGIGKDKDGKLYLVTTCGNCGDYHYLEVNEVLTFLGKENI